MPTTPQRPKGSGPFGRGRGKLSGSLTGGGNRPAASILWLMLLFLVGLWVWTSFGPGSESRTRISYSAFVAQVKKGNVERITNKGQKITGVLSHPASKPGASGQGKSATYTRFVTYLPSFQDATLNQLLESKNVEVDTEPTSNFSWWALLLNVLPFLLLIWLGVLFFRRMQAQGQSIFSMGKSRAKAYEENGDRTTFDDVAGLQGAKRELQEVVGFLRDPERFQRLGGEIPRGILLVGPPGTGKTLLARAVAGEAEVPFYNITGSDFMEMLVGVGASRVRDLFRQAKEHSPAIIFIDELDSIGRRRGAGLGGGHDEREQTLNQLLSEMDGFEPSHQVIVMAATNRPDILDPALLRPGRFDRRITVNLPTLEDRLAILKIHAQNKVLAGDVDLRSIARGTPGFSGADLKNLLNEAALLAARDDRPDIDEDHIELARDKVMMGLKRENLALSDEECRTLAYHEGGHAVLAALLPHADPLHKVTIVPRGKAMGITQQLPEREKYIYPREYLQDRLAVMMGGRAAEDLVLETATSGAEQDLKQATQLARRMVLDWGMSDRIGHLALGGERRQVFLGEEIGHQREYSEATAREVDEEVRRLLDDAYGRACEVLTANRQGLDRIAEELLSREEIEASRVEELLGEGATPEETPDRGGAAVEPSGDGRSGAGGDAEGRDLSGEPRAAVP